MKSLIQFIKESLVNERLNASDYLLLDTYDKAKDYFNKHYNNQSNNQPLEETDFGISLEAIEPIYKIAKKYHKPAPFVGRYGSEKVFVMRRWVESKLDMWRRVLQYSKSLSKYANIIQPDWFWKPIRGVYQGPHDTSLKEDNFYRPSAEDMEVIIAFAVNRKLDETLNSDKKLDAKQNIKFCATDKSKKHTQKEENMLNYYQYNQDFINKCADKLIEQAGLQANDKLHKLPNESGKPNSTPKTDLISSNGNYKISLKKAGGAQLMSGGYYEAKATLLSAAQDCKLPEYDKLKSLLSKSWAKIKCRGIRQERKEETKTKESIQGYEENIATINDYLNKLTDPDPKNTKTYNEDFKRALLIEAMSGNHKFGKNSNSAANCVFVWSENEKENQFYPSIEDYVNHIINNVKIGISWKTGKSSSYQALRIRT